MVWVPFPLTIVPPVTVQLKAPAPLVEKAVFMPAHTVNGPYTVNCPSGVMAKLALLVQLKIWCVIFTLTVPGVLP